VIPVAAVTLCWLVPASSALADTPAPAPAEPPQVKAFLQLLDDPAVQHWLANRKSAEAKPLAPAAETGSANVTVSNYFESRLAAIQAHLAGLAAALPMLPGEFERVWTTLMLEFEQRGLFKVLLLAVGFIAIGFAVEQLFFWAAKGARRRIS